MFSITFFISLTYSGVKIKSIKKHVAIDNSGLVEYIKSQLLRILIDSFVAQAKRGWPVVCIAGKGDPPQFSAPH
uniref:Uncharacterized protein n=1 Tax=Pararge aegeria TaxID=116150 RepID=S4PRH9_9NEOP